MIVQWTSIKPLIARVVRNTPNVDADTLTDLPEWLAEGIGKLKTHYQLELECETVDVKFHLCMLPCKAEAIAAVTYCGQRLMISDEVAPALGSGRHLTAPPLFESIVRMPGGIQSLDETDINNYPFYLSTIGTLENMGVSSSQFYRPRYNKIETSIETGQLTIYYWTVPHDKEGLPVVPKNEDYHTALYWYCRMMMIGAGYEDPVFRYGDCEQRWELHAGRAIGQITYPTVDEKKRSIINNVSLIPNQYDWETFGGNGPEGSYID